MANYACFYGEVAFSHLHGLAEGSSPPPRHSAEVALDQFICGGKIIHAIDLPIDPGPRRGQREAITAVKLLYIWSLSRHPAA